MTTQVPASLARFPWAAGLRSRLCLQPLGARQRRALEHSLQAQSIAVAVRSLTSSVSYAALPRLEDMGRLRVHPRADVVTTPGGFRVCLRQGQALLQRPDGVWTELAPELLSPHAARRPRADAPSTHVLLPDGTRLTLEPPEPHARRRVFISHGSQHLAAEAALDASVWQPARHGPPLAPRQAPPDAARYEAMIDDGLPRCTPAVRPSNALMAWGARFLEETAPQPEVRPMNHTQPQLTREELYELAGQGHNLYEAGEIDAARELFENLTERDPNDSFFHSSLGAIYQHQGALERAVAEYDQALRLNELDIPARCNRAEALLQQGHTEAAIQDLERISELDPHAQCGHTLRARNIALTLLTLVDGQSGPRKASR